MLNPGRLLPTLVPVLAPVVLTAALAAALPVSAADLGAGYEYGARSVGPEAYGRSFEEPPAYGRSIERRAEVEKCRVVVRRRVNDYGEEVVRRARICDEEPVAYGRSREPRFADSGRGSEEDDLVPPADIPDEEGTLR